MSYRNSKPAPAPDMRSEGVEEAWLAEIREAYGVSLGTGQLYADNRGMVFAGSEYVAQLGRIGGRWQLAPQYAHTWTKTIHHAPRGAHRNEVAHRG